MAIMTMAEYKTAPPANSADGQHCRLQVDEDSNLKVVTRSKVPDTAAVLAKATGSDGGLGKIAALAASEVIYVRLDCSDRPYAYVDWIVNTTATTDVAFYVGRSLADSVTLTLSSFTDTNTIIMNGLTLTGEATAADAAFASRRFSTAGGTDTLDAVELAKLINADYAVTVDGSVTVGDYLSIVTDEGTYKLSAAATPVYTTGTWDQSGNQAAELASLVLAINHTQNVTCATAVAGDTVTVNGVVYTGVEGAATTADHEFSVDTSNDACATSIAAAINSTDGGVSGVTASATAAVVYLYRDSEADSISLSSSDGTTLACVTTVGGVPGVTAVATGATGELSITPTWTSTLTVADYASAGGATTHITTVDIDQPGLYATSAEGVVTVVPGTPASQSSGELATVIQATAAANCTVSKATTLDSLYLIDATTGANMADNHLTAGTIFHVPQYGYEYAYCGLTADGTTPTISVSAIGRE